MEELLSLGMLPFVGLCAGAGALAFLVTRAVTPAKQCSGITDDYTNWSSQTGKYKQFAPGQRRIVHVSRSAIGINMRNPTTVYPSGVVVDEHGKKHEFHEIFLHGSSQLIFDRDGETANVYLITFGQITGRHLVDQPYELDENLVADPNKKLRDTQNRYELLQKDYETQRQNLVSVQEENSRLNTHVEQLEKHFNHERTEEQPTRQKDFSQTYKMVDTLTQERNGLLHERDKLRKELNEERQSQTFLPFNNDIDFVNQTRSVRKTRQRRVTIGCSPYYEDETYYENEELTHGEEGYIDRHDQVKYVRVRERDVKNVICAVPLVEGDPGFGEVPC